MPTDRHFCPLCGEEANLRDYSYRAFTPLDGETTFWVHWDIESCEAIDTINLMYEDRDWLHKMRLSKHRMCHPPSPPKTKLRLRYYDATETSRKD